MLKAGPSSTVAAAAAVVSAWAEAAGGVSDERKGLLQNLVTRSMDIGHWALTDDIAILTGANETQALTLLKSRRRMAAYNSPTFTANAGYAFDGLSSYIDTGFNPSTMGAAMGFGNLRMAVYERTNVASNGNAIGSTGGQTAVMTPRRTTGDICLFQLASSANITTITGVTDSRGLTAQSRAGGSTTGNTWKNGVALTDVTGLTVSNTALPTQSFLVGARNNSGGANTFRASTIGAAEWGAPLPSGAAEAAWYQALQAFMTAIGANV
jgi:hypothetical protein